MFRLCKRLLLLLIVSFLPSCLTSASQTGLKPADEAVIVTKEWFVGDIVHMPTDLCPAGACYSPQWSPDGSQIIFEAAWPSRYGEIVIANADLSQFRALLPGTEDAEAMPRVALTPQSSPDFITSDVRVVTATVLVVTAVPGKYPEGTYSQPRWSPDGRQVAFEFIPFEKSSRYPQGLYVVDADGQNLKLVTPYNPGSSSGLHWAQNGQQLYYVFENESGRTWVARINADGTNQQLLMEFEHPMWFEWSVDDTQMAYKSGGDLYVMNADGTGKKKLTNNPSNESIDTFGWSPDGKRLVYNTVRSDIHELRLYVIRADGTGKQLIASEGDYRSPAWSPDGEWLVMTSKAPNGQTIVTKLPVSF